MLYPEEEQQIFDMCVDHLWRQNRQARATWPSCHCMYRDVMGCKCGFGIFIPDEIYKPEMECNTVRGLLRVDGVPDDMKAWIRYNLDLLLALQSMHDNYYTVLKNFRRYILDVSDCIATKFRLQHFIPPAEDIQIVVKIIPRLSPLLTMLQPQ